MLQKSRPIRYLTLKAFIQRKTNTHHHNQLHQSEITRALHKLKVNRNKFLKIQTRIMNLTKMVPALRMIILMQIAATLVFKELFNQDSTTRTVRFFRPFSQLQKNLQNKSHQKRMLHPQTKFHLKSIRNNRHTNRNKLQTVQLYFRERMSYKNTGKSMKNTSTGEMMKICFTFNPMISRTKQYAYKQRESIVWNTTILSKTISTITVNPQQYFCQMMLKHW